MGFIEVRSSILHTPPLSLHPHKQACNQAMSVGPCMPLEQDLFDLACVSVRRLQESLVLHDAAGPFGEKL